MNAVQATNKESMQTIILEQELACPAGAVWEIVSDVCRSDWVPMVDSITLNGDVRSFEMAGVGQIQERILEVDHDALRLRYSAISTPANIEHHLAMIYIVPNGNSCTLQWNTEISPDRYVETVRGGMQLSIDGLRKILRLS